MLRNSPEVLDADDNVELVFRHFEALKLVSLDSDRRMKRLLQYLCIYLCKHYAGWE
jgi:hypothetical protein